VPRSAGTYDCDTSDALGGPILIGFLFIPAFGLAALGKGTAIAVRRTPTR